MVNGERSAQDFVYSWRRTINSKTASPYSYLFSGIKRGRDHRGQKRPSLQYFRQGQDTVIVKLDTDRLL